MNSGGKSGISRSGRYTILVVAFLGWAFAGDALANVTEPDVQLLVLKGTSGPQQALNEDRILWRYPDLAKLEKSQWGSMLKRKILEDAKLMTLHGNLLAAVMSAMFFLPVAMTAGYYFRLKKNSSSFLSRSLRGWQCYFRYAQRGYWSYFGQVRCLPIPCGRHPGQRMGPCCCAYCSCRFRCSPFGTSSRLACDLYCT